MAFRWPVIYGAYLTGRMKKVGAQSLDLCTGVRKAQWKQQPISQSNTGPKMDTKNMVSEEFYAFTLLPLVMLRAVFINPYKGKPDSDFIITIETSKLLHPKIAKLWAQFSMQETQ